MDVDKMVKAFVDAKLIELGGEKSYPYALGACQSMMGSIIRQMTPEQQKKVFASLQFQINFGK